MMHHRQASSGAPMAQHGPIDVPKNELNKKLFVTKGFHVKFEDVMALFKTHGNVQESYNSEKGWCFITMATHTDAVIAKAKLDGQSIDGNPITVRWSTPNKTVLVDGLPENFTNAHLHMAFSARGPILSAVVWSKGGKSCSKGTVTFKSKHTYEKLLRDVEAGQHFVVQPFMTHDKFVPRAVSITKHTATDHIEGVRRHPTRLLNLGIVALHSPKGGTVEHAMMTEWVNIAKFEKEQMDLLKQKVQQMRNDCLNNQKAKVQEMVGKEMQREQHMAAMHQQQQQMQQQQLRVLGSPRGGPQMIPVNAAMPSHMQMRSPQQLQMHSPQRGMQPGQQLQRVGQPIRMRHPQDASNGMMNKRQRVVLVNTPGQPAQFAAPGPGQAMVAGPPMAQQVVMGASPTRFLQPRMQQQPRPVIQQPRPVMQQPMAQQPRPVMGHVPGQKLVMYGSPPQQQQQMRPFMVRMS